MDIPIAIADTDSLKGTVIAEDTGELLLHGRTSRRKDADTESITSRVSGLSGPKAYSQYLLCLQLILRKQLKWLIQDKGLPVELETLLHDLWALRLQTVSSKISYNSDGETTDGETTQKFSSQSEEDTSDSQSTRRSRKRRSVNKEPAVNPDELLGLCYVALILLRIPVTIADFYSWVVNGELLYFKAAKEIPMPMRERLPATYQAMLEPHYLRSPQKLHAAVTSLLDLFSKNFGMSMPEINSHLVLFRFVRRLALPIEVYLATQRLASVLEVDFSFTMTEQQGRSGLYSRNPETRLMAVLIIATKLLFPCDDLTRYPYSVSDLNALKHDWPAWVAAHQNEENEPTLDFREALTMSEKDALDLSEDKLDQYLDWYEDVIANEEIRQSRDSRDNDFRKALFDFFPASRERPPHQDEQRGSGTDEVAERIKQVQSTLKRLKILPDRDDVHRAGEYYRRYRNVDELEGPMKLFYEKAASLAGLELSTMVQLVFKYERQLQGEEEQSRREQMRIQPNSRSKGKGKAVN